MLSGLEREYDVRRTARIARELRFEDGAEEVISVPVRRLDGLLRGHDLHDIDF